MSVSWGQRTLGILGGLVGAIACHLPAMAKPSTDLFVAYPPPTHETVADSIFFIGTADPNEPVTINGQPIENRSSDGHFAPTLPLQLGENTFTLTQGDESLTLVINRVSNEPPLPAGVGFAEGTLLPAEDMARLPGELVCLSAIAPPNAQVSATLGSAKYCAYPSNQRRSPAQLLRPNRPNRARYFERYRVRRLPDDDRTWQPRQPSLYASSSRANRHRHRSRAGEHFVTDRLSSCRSHCRGRCRPHWPKHQLLAHHAFTQRHPRRHYRTGGRMAAARLRRLDKSQ